MPTHVSRGREPIPNGVWRRGVFALPRRLVVCNQTAIKLEDPVPTISSTSIWTYSVIADPLVLMSGEGSHPAEAVAVMASDRCVGERGIEISPPEAG
jgi:hypothetical protein